MFSYLELTKLETEKVVQILLSYINTTNSNIVKVFSLQTLLELTLKDTSYKPQIIKKLKQMINIDSPAVINSSINIIYKLNETNIN